MDALRTSLALLMALSLFTPAMAADDDPLENVDVRTASDAQSKHKSVDTPDGKALTDEALSKVAASISAYRGDATDDLLDIDQQDAWRRLYAAAEKQVQNRQFDEAEKTLLEAVKQAKHGISGERKLIVSRNLLADVYAATDQVDEAEKLYSWSMNAARHAFGPESAPEAHAQSGLAAALLVKGRYAEAQELCKSAIKTRAKLVGKQHHDYGQSLITMGCILSREGMAEDSAKFFARGLTILAASPGVKQLDYADALRLAALCTERQGDANGAQPLFEQSYAIKDRAVTFGESAQLKGTVRFQWEDGSPRAEEISDPEVPVRYMCSDNIRVACSVIDLWELFGIVISVTNVGDHRQEIGLGKVQFVRTTGDALDPKAERLELIDPQRIDRIRREMDIWRLTANKPWFANMEKTRNIRGFVPAHGHDLWRGPNVFGVYGEWAPTSRVLPERFQLELSPEHVTEQAQVVVDPSLVRTNNSKILGLVPVTLEPFESRTGELFYMNPRCEHVLLRVYVGNAVFEFPFKTPKKRTSI
jgi:tetratricopeptide (TPR) repeat protein